VTMRDRMLGDTTPEALAVEVHILRRIGPTGRLAMMFELSDNLRSLVEAGVRHRHPDWDGQRVERDVIRLMIGDTLFQEVYRSGRL
jgi:hypothetical protein